MGALIKALIWAGQMAMGWMVGDVVNEYHTTKQAVAATGQIPDNVKIVGHAVQKTWYQKAQSWIIGILILIAVFFGLQLFKVGRQITRTK